MGIYILANFYVKSLSPFWQLGSLQITKDHLTQQVIQYQEKTARLEGLLKQKDKEGEELKRRLKAGQIATEEIIFEKINLASKIQKMQKEAEEQHRRINELISINEELLEFSQMKEDQVGGILTIFFAFLFVFFHIVWLLPWQRFFSPITSNGFFGIQIMSILTFQSGVYS